MGESLVEVSQARDESQIPDNQTNELLLAQAVPVGEPQSLVSMRSSTAQGAFGDNDFDRLLQNSAAARVGYVAVDGLAKTVPGAIDAAVHDWNNKGELATKVGGGLLFGMGMRTVLAKSGVGRAIAGGVFTYYLAKDAVTPVAEALGVAAEANDRQTLELAGDHMGQGLGHFTWNSSIGIASAVGGEKIMGGVLRVGLGRNRFERFEQYKQDMWTSDQYLLGRTLNGIGRRTRGVTTALSERLVPRETPVETRRASSQEIASARQELLDHRQQGRSYYRGSEFKNGEHLGLTETVDLLLAGRRPTQMTTGEAVTVLGLRPGRASVDSFVFKPGGKSGEILVPDRTLVGTDGKPLGGKPRGPATEVTAEGLSRLSAEYKRTMQAMSSERQVLLDRMESTESHPYVAHKPRHTPMDPGYYEVVGQQRALHGQTRTARDYEQYAWLDEYIGMSHQQHNVGIGNPNGFTVRGLNSVGIEMHTFLRQRMAEKGLPPEVLTDKNPPLFMIKYDGGAGPHTVPKVEGVSPSMVLWPRNMYELRSSGTSGINGHEIWHDQWGGMARFPEGIRNRVIRQDVIEAALGKEVAAEMINVPGIGRVPKHEAIAQILKATANENTADMGGAAWTGPNSGMALGALLQSFRQGGKLETRNIYGREMRTPENPWGIEVHSPDRFRILLVAETINQRAPKDPLLQAHVKALREYADAASREGDYIWASRDNPGQSITIPRAEMEAIIPKLVKAQLETPLELVPQGPGSKVTFGDLLPELPRIYRNMDHLAERWATAIMEGKRPESIVFSKNDYTMNEVWGAGMPAQLKLVERGMSAREANAAVNRFSDHFREQYYTGDPHAGPLTTPSALTAIRTRPKQVFTTAREAAGNTVGALPRAAGFMDRNVVGLSRGVEGPQGIADDATWLYGKATSLGDLMSGNRAAGAGLQGVKLTSMLGTLEDLKAVRAQEEILLPENTSG